MKGTAILTWTNTNLKQSTKNLPNVNPAYLPTYGENIATDKAASIKSACQALSALTSNTLNDVKVRSEESIANYTGGE